MEYFLAVRLYFSLILWSESKLWDCKVKVVVGTREGPWDMAILNYRWALSFAWPTLGAKPTV